MSFLDFDAFKSISQAACIPQVLGPATFCIHPAVEAATCTGRWYVSQPSSLQLSSLSSKPYWRQACLPCWQSWKKGWYTSLQGIFTASSGRIVVAESNNQCIQVFYNDVEFKFCFGVQGCSPGQLQPPQVWQWTPMETLSWQIMTLVGSALFLVRKSKRWAGHLMGLRGVIIDLNGHVVVVDNLLHLHFPAQ